MSHTQNAAPDALDHRTSEEKVLFTSRGLGWQGFLVETRLHSCGEFRYLPSCNHLISLHLGAPITLEQGENEARLRLQQVRYGSTLVVPAGQPSLWRHTDASHFLNISLSNILLDRMRERLELKSIETPMRASPAAFHDSHLQQIAMLLRWEMEAGAPYGSLYAETLAEALAVHLLQRERGQTRLLASAPPATKLLRVEMKRAVAYIEENLATDLSLPVIARACGMSTHHFARLFAQLLGTTPHQYIIQARIERAKELISRDGVPLVTVAGLVGFADQSHFTRHFKRLVGVTPHIFAGEANRKNLPATSQK